MLHNHSRHPHNADTRPSGADHHTAETTNQARQDTEQKEGPRLNGMNDQNGLCNIFIAHVGNSVLYAPREQVWYDYNGRYWQRDDEGRVLRILRRLVSTLYTAAMERRDFEGANFALSMQNDHALRSTLAYARSVPALQLPEHGWNHDPYLFNTSNGTLNLRTGRLRTHRKDDYIDRVAGSAFDANARAEAFGLMLDRWLPGGRNGIAARYLQMTLGLALIGKRSVERLHVVESDAVPFAYLLIYAIHSVWGGYAYIDSVENIAAALRSRTLPSARRATAFLGVRTVMMPLTEEHNGAANVAALVERFARQRVIPLRAGPGDYPELVPDFTTLLFARHLPPRLDERTRARLGIIPAPERGGLTIDIQRFKHVIAAEAPGILNFALAGLVKYQTYLSLPDLSTLRPTTGTVKPLSAQQLSRAHVEANERMLEWFIRERCSQGKESRVLRSRFHEAFSEWLRAKGIQGTTSGALSPVMQRQGFKSDKRHWLGITLEGEW